MKTRKKMSKDMFRKLLRWKSPKRTQKYVDRKYIGTFLNCKTENVPLYEVYSRDPLPEEKTCYCCYSKKVVPMPYSNLKKKQSYVWRISGGLIPFV